MGNKIVVLAVERLSKRGIIIRHPPSLKLRRTSKAYMHHPVVKHTIDIFERILNDLPPLVPKDVSDDMEHALEQIKLNVDLTLLEVEDTMIVFGKAIWPYRRAFDEFVSTCEGKLGEQFLSARLTKSMKHRYKEFTAHGGEYRQLHSGALVDFFTPEERQELTLVLITVRQELQKHTAQEVLSTRQHEYQDKIVEFQTILDDMEKRLDSLRLMADDEQEHPQLAAEIREHIRSFEYGLTALGPHPDHDALCNAEEYFHGRRTFKHLRRSYTV